MEKSNSPVSTHRLLNLIGYGALGWKLKNYIVASIIRQTAEEILAEDIVSTIEDNG